jgi:phosphohistidine phosphatase
MSTSPPRSDSSLGASSSRIGGRQLLAGGAHTTDDRVDHLAVQPASSTDGQNARLRTHITSASTRRPNPELGDLASLDQLRRVVHIRRSAPCRRAPNDAPNDGVSARPRGRHQARRARSRSGVRGQRRDGHLLSHVCQRRLLGRPGPGALIVMAVQLYLVQHGQAKAENEDPERPLTDQGVDDVARVGRHAVEQLGVRAARVVHSGKTRARQTAEIWGGLLDADVEQGGPLAPNDDPRTWLERLDVEADDVLLVGHLPFLARLAALLLTGVSDHPVVRFRQGGLVGLERTDQGWVVSVVLPP